ncbi:MAG: O-antigen polymerase family protein [Deltaproteobacteria bacterium]|nr:O-antigen polymerase family protein [Deltaproteobacteria bacterium]
MKPWGEASERPRAEASRSYLAYGLAILIIGSLIAPVAIPTGTKTRLNFTVLMLPVLSGLWVLKAASRRDWSVLSLRPVAPLLALVTAALLSFAVVNQPWVYIAPLAPLRAQLGGLSVFMLSAALFIIAADELRDLRWLGVLTGLFLVLGATYILARLAWPVGDHVLPLVQKGATGSLFWTWLVALAFGQAVFNRRLNVVLRLALGVVVLATLYTGLTQGRDWLSGWLPPLVAIVTILWVGAPRLGGAVTIAGGTLVALYTPHLLALVFSADNQYSLKTRLAAWGVLGKIVAASPALGFGPANYYHVTPLFPILRWYVHFSSHNTYVDLLAQTGLIGLGCFGWFVWEMARTGWSLRQRVPVGFAQAYVLSALGGLAGTLAAGMLCDWVLPFVYNITLDGLRASMLAWLFLGGLLALQRTVPAGGRHE